MSRFGGSSWVVSSVIVALVLASTPGCRAGFSEAACTGESFSFAAALVPTYEYAELRETTRGSGTTTIETVGAKCKTAKDPAACADAVAKASADAGMSNGSHGRVHGFRYLVVTRGDEVRVLGTSLGPALAPIDSPAKAAAVAASERSLDPACRNSVRRAGPDFEVHLVTSSCLGPMDEVIRVRRDGTIEVVKSESGSPTCVGLFEAASRGPSKGT